VDFWLRHLGLQAAVVCRLKLIRTFENIAIESQVNGNRGYAFTRRKGKGHMLQCRILMLLSIFSTALCYGQINVGRITGTVTDQSGAVVPGVTVNAEEESSGVRSVAITGENGSYVFTSLTPGSYNLRVEREGFTGVRQTGIVLDAASSRTVNVVLNPGVVTESISVSAGAEQIKTDSGEVSSTLDNRKLDQIAMNGRNYYNLVRLLPGVTTNPTDPAAIGVNMTGTFINGSRNPSTGVFLDGVNNIANDQNSYQAVVPNPDTIAEIKVLTSSYTAEHGGNAGAMITIISKSGGKEFHGSLFEFFRHHKLDARSFLAAQREDLRLNDFGATFGGPVFIPRKFNPDRNKLFFFTSFEKKIYHFKTAAVSVVPTALERAGNFQGTRLGTPIDPSTGAPFPSAIVPATRWAPNGPRLIDIYPLPNSSSSAGNFVRNPLTALEPLTFQQKLDFVPSDKMRVTATYAMNTDFRWNDGGNLGITRSVLGTGQPGWIAGTNMTYMISPTLLNYISFGVNHQDFSFEPPVPSLDRKVSGLNYPLLPGVNPYNSRPRMNLAGLTGLSYAFPSKGNTTFELRDDVTKVMGGHILKAGVMFSRSRDNENTTGFRNEGGTLTFNNSATSSARNPVADALLGNFFQYTQDQYSVFGWARFSTFEAYAQDSWTVNRRLHLDLGVRYSLAALPYTPVGNVSVFFPSIYDRNKAVTVDSRSGAIVAGSGDIYNGLALLGNSWSDYPARDRIPPIAGDINRFNSLFRGLPKTIWNNRTNNFAPRFGFAYDPTGSGKTAIRGGFGIFYDRPAANIYLLSMALNAPTNYSYNVFNGNIENIAAALNATYPANLTTVGEKFKTPYMMTYNFNVQRQLPAQIILEIGYVGTQARHLARGVDLNQLPVGTLKRPENAGLAVNSLRPFRGYGTITSYDYADTSGYNGLQVSANRRMASGMSVGSSFTWSKALDQLPAQTGFTPTVVQNSYNARSDRGPSTVNRKYVFSVNAQYELPFARRQRGLVQTVAGGWTLSSVFFAQSGAPTSVTVNSDVAGIGVGSSRASLVSGADLHVEDRTPQRWFNTSAFLPAAQMIQGQFGNSGRNILTGPGYSQLDLSFFKRFVIREGRDIEFRAESFNVLNHASFTSVGTVVGTPTFGAVTATGNPRINQFALKVHF